MKRKVTDEYFLLKHIYETYKPSEIEGETNYWLGANTYMNEFKEYKNPIEV